MERGFVYSVKTITSIIVFSSIAVLIPHLALASPSSSCDCCRYTDIAEQIRLSAQSAAIILKASRVNSFVDGIREKGRLALPKECWSYFDLGSFLGPSIEIKMQYSTAEKAAPAQVTEMPMKLLRRYTEMILGFVRSCQKNNSASNATELYNACLRDNFRAAALEFNKIYTSGVDNSIINNQEKGLSTSEKKTIRLFHEMNFNSDILGHLKRNTKGRGRNYSPEEVLMAVSIWGWQRNEFYDGDRLNGVNGAGKGIVTLEQLQENTRQNYFIGLYHSRYPTPIASEGRNLGVCRDIMTAQALMLKAAGFKSTYMISFDTMTGAHQVAITRHPTDKKLFVLDYGNIQHRGQTNFMALFQGGSDRGITYDVNIPGGKRALVTQSEFGRFLSSAAGFDIQKWDPLARERGHLVAGVASLSGGRQHDVSLRTGTGEDALGAFYMFAGINGSIGNAAGRFGKLTVGTIYANQQRKGLVMGLPNGKILNLDVLYGRLEYLYRTKELKLGREFNLRFEALAQGLFSYVRNRDGMDKDDPAKGKAAKTYEGLAGGGVILEQGNPEIRKFTSRYEARFQMGGTDYNDSRLGEGKMKPTAFLQYLLFNARFRYALAKTEKGRAFLVAATSLVINELGQSGVVEAGVAAPQVSVMARIEGRLGEHTALFQDGAERRFGGRIVYSPTDYLSLVLDISSALERRKSGEIPTEGTTVFMNAQVQY